MLRIASNLNFVKTTVPFAVSRTKSLDEIVPGRWRCYTIIMPHTPPILLDRLGENICDQVAPIVMTVDMGNLPSICNNLHGADYERLVDHARLYRWNSSALTDGVVSLIRFDGPGPSSLIIFGQAQYDYVVNGEKQGPIFWARDGWMEYACVDTPEGLVKHPDVPDWCVAVE